MANSVADELIHTTVRIETMNARGERGSGTGFIVQLCKLGEQHVPVIITNWHVVEGAVWSAFHMTIAGTDGLPMFGAHKEVRLPQSDAVWVRHPNPDVDLAAFPLAPALNYISAQGVRPFYRGFDPGIIADDNFFSELVAVEDVLMIGYPNGLWDDHNNLPLVRRGITATPPGVPFRGRPEFVIDCACFPGSSGSPVILYNIGGHIKKGGGLHIGQGRVKLLGILHAGPRYTTQGEVQVVPVPTATKVITLSPQHINLGYCIRASEVMAFERHFEPLMAAERRKHDAGTQAASPGNDNAPPVAPTGTATDATSTAQ